RERELDVLAELVEQGEVAGPRGMPRDENEEERCGIHRSVVRRVWDEAQACHLADADRVQNFSRLLIAPFVGLSRLVEREQARRLLGDARLVREHLDGGDRGIAAEECRE